MKYISTRGKSPELSFCDVLLGGLGARWWLYFQTYPKFTENELDAMTSRVYQDLAFKIFEKFIDDIPLKI